MRSDADNSRNSRSGDSELDAVLREAAADETELPGAAEVLAGTRQRIAAEDASLRGRVRARSTAVRSALCAGSVALMLTAVLAVAARPDLIAYPAERLLLDVGVLALLWTLSFAVAMRPLHRPSLSPARVRGGVGLTLLAVAVLYLLPQVQTGHPASVQAAGVAGLLGQAGGCLGWGLALGIPVFALLHWLDRGGHPHGPLCAVSAGVAANMVLFVHCPVTASPHMLLGHFTVILVLLGLYLALSSRESSEDRVAASVRD